MRLFFNRWEAVSAGDVIGGLFIAQRIVLEATRTQALAGTGLSPELAEILIELYLAGEKLSSLECVDAEGFVPSRVLLAALGYSAGLLSRRTGWLCEHGWAETKRTTPNPGGGLHGNCQKVRITEPGKAKIAPIWQSYDKLARHLLADLSPSDLAAHYRVNEIIASKLRAPKFLRENMGEGAGGEPLPSVAGQARVSPRRAYPPKAAAEESSQPEPTPKQFLPPYQGDFLD